MPRFVGRPKLVAEDGRVLLLGLAACVFLAVLILMSVSASGIYLEQRRLQRLADQTASMAASEIDEEYYAREDLADGVELHIDQSGSYQRAADYLSSLDDASFGSMRNITLHSVSTTPTRVRVTLRATGTIPIALPLVSNLTEIQMQASGQAGLKTTDG